MHQVPRYVVYFVDVIMTGEVMMILKYGKGRGNDR